MTKISPQALIATIVFILALNIGLITYGLSLLVEEIWFIGLLYIFLIIMVDFVILMALIRLSYSNYKRTYE